jgi:hypothetical protein
MCAGSNGAVVGVADESDAVDVGIDEAEEFAGIGAKGEGDSGVGHWLSPLLVAASYTRRNFRQPLFFACGGIFFVHDVRMKLDQYLREHRITQTAFAAQVGVPVSRVNDWVKGNGKPTLERLAAIQAATGGAVGLADFVEVRDA